MTEFQGHYVNSGGEEGEERKKKGRSRGLMPFLGPLRRILA